MMLSLCSIPFLFVTSSRYIWGLRSVAAASILDTEFKLPSLLSLSFHYSTNVFSRQKFWTVGRSDQ